jgi:hypothetical protein
MEPAKKRRSSRNVRPERRYTCLIGYLSGALIAATLTGCVPSAPPTLKPPPPVYGISPELPSSKPLFVVTRFRVCGNTRYPCAPRTEKHPPHVK